MNAPTPVQQSSAALRRRHRAERRFRFYGVLALGIGISMLAGLLLTIAVRAWPAFQQHYWIVALAPDEADAADANAADDGAARALVRTRLAAAMPRDAARAERRAIRRSLSVGAPAIAASQLRDGAETLHLPLAADADLWLKGMRAPASDAERAAFAWLEQQRAAGAVERGFAHRLFLAGDSREPELAGLRGALQGSAWTMMLVLLLSFPLGVAAGIYLQELAPKNRFTDAIEINMNNLAAVPSIVFGLLGLAVFIGWFGLPRSAPLVGGMVLSLMTLPTIIIATRASLGAVPNSLRHAALALGASRMQMIFHHILPYAMPGILTGTIIGLAQAAGETAPLLMIGMLAFVVDAPGAITDAATVLPAQIYMWADSPERAFQAKTSAAILVLLGFLFALNALALILRLRFGRRW